MKLKQLISCLNKDDIYCLNQEKVENHEDDSINLITQSLKSLYDQSIEGIILVIPTLDLSDASQIRYDQITINSLLNIRLSSIFINDYQLIDLFRSFSCPVFCVKQQKTTNQIFGQLCYHYYNYPQKYFKEMIGVTGTNGKTTVTHMIEKVLAESRLSVGLIGSLGYRLNLNEYRETKCTTPYSWLLQKIFSEMLAENKIENIVMEVSSYGLAVERIYGCEFSVAVFTNLTQDHLKFHKNMEDYLQVKLLLFSKYLRRSSSPIAILNHDDPSFQRFLDVCPLNAKIFTYSVTNKGANCFVGYDIETSLNGTSYTLLCPSGEQRRVCLQVHGLFNVYNSLACLSTCIATYSNSLTLDQIIKPIETYKCATARFEFVVKHNPFSVVVDYAHTPDALLNVAKCGKEILTKSNENGRLIVVFGCNGRGDELKRPIMGEIAYNYGDIIIVTSANPRQEDPQNIIDDILSGIESKDSGKKVFSEVDRIKAIHLAMDLANGTHDLIIIAGKGHETTQAVLNENIPFDEKQIILDKYQKMFNENSSQIQHKFQ